MKAEEPAHARPVLRAGEEEGEDMAKNVYSLAACAMGSLVAASSASADFVFVSAEEVDVGAPDGFVTYRVVAHFDGPDIVLAWGGIPGVGELNFFTCDQTELLNAGGPFDGLKQEDFAQFPIAEEYDSYVTVGATGFEGNQTDYSPGFIGSDGVTNAVKGNAFSEDDGLVFDSDPTSAVFGPDVVLAQFTLPGPGGSLPPFVLEGVIAWNTPAGGGFQTSLFHVNCIPAPGALSLLGLAGLAGARRRRNQ